MPVEGDRRAMQVRLTEAGREAFARMAEVHEGWVNSMLGSLDDEDAARLLALLGNVSINGRKVT